MKLTTPPQSGSESSFAGYGLFRSDNMGIAIGQSRMALLHGQNRALQPLNP